jgi:hypothetical protein
MNGLAIVIGIMITGEAASGGTPPVLNAILSETGVDLVAENGTDVLILE